MLGFVWTLFLRDFLFFIVEMVVGLLLFNVGYLTLVFAITALRVSVRNSRYSLVLFRGNCSREKNQILLQL